ncbi:O-antigen ligase C-terminal domain-containing protein [Enterobacter cloacae complex sp. P6RS]|nr:O-antigen ligase C-terminal domain-containing protein [Enterobacter cloacae complex sp. P6RS]
MFFFLSYKIKNRPSFFVSTGGALFAIPWFFYIRTSPDVLIFLLALVGYVIISFESISKVSRVCILQVIFSLALCQVILCFIQSFLPNVAKDWYEYNWLRNGGRPYGIFQQVNLLASFLASGLACGYLLLMQEKRIYRQYVIITGLAAIAIILAINQSRTGWIGAVAAILLLNIFFITSRPRQCIEGTVAMCLAAAFGIWIVQHVSVLINGQHWTLSREYINSNHDRWAMLTTTWKMIMDKPVTGWGYGAFESQYIHYLLDHPQLNVKHSSIIPHPHNELLFAWVQGGVIAVTGLLLMAAGWIKFFINAIRSGAVNTGYAVLIIPLLVHLNLEYPLYQSFIHLGLFVVLLRLADTRELSQKKDVSKAQKNRLMRFSGAIIGCIVVVYGIIGLYANNEITRLERHELAAFPVSPPWYFETQRERSNFDSMIALLVDYNTTRSEQDLALFIKKATPWLDYGVDKNLLVSMITILRYRGDNEEAAKLYAEYSLIE